MTKNTKSFSYILLLFIILTVNSYWLWDLEIIEYWHDGLGWIAPVVSLVSLFLCVCIGSLFWRCDRKQKTIVVLVCVLLLPLYNFAEHHRVDTYWVMGYALNYKYELDKYSRYILEFYHRTNRYPDSLAGYTEYPHDGSEVSFEPIGENLTA